MGSQDEVAGNPAEDDMNAQIWFGTSLLLSCLSPAGLAQGGGLPPSFTEPGLLPLSSVALESVSPVTSLEIADLDAASADWKITPIAVDRKARFDTQQHGTWESLSSGDSLWRLRVGATGALWLQPTFGTWRVPEGAEMWVYPQSLSPVIGPFEADDVAELHGQRPIGRVDTDTVVIELLWPQSLGTAVPNIDLTRLSVGFRDPYGWEDDCGMECTPDTSCDIGVDLSVIKRGFVRTYPKIDLCSGGNLVTSTAMCSGTLINTTAGDCSQYVLTAGHCTSNKAHGPDYRFLFNFERPGCCSGEPPAEGQRDEVFGATILAEWDGGPGGAIPPGCALGPFIGSDMALLRIDEEIPASFDVRFNGWSRSGVNATGALSVHMPGGYKSMKVASSFDGYTQHSDTKFWDLDWEEGRTLAGSSGAPVFDQALRVTGHLWGGPAESLNCPGENDRYGRLASGWEGGGVATKRLKDWLDPAQTNAISIPGREDLPGGACGVKPWTTIAGVDTGTVPAHSPGGSGGGGRVSVGTSALVTLRNEGQSPLTNVAATLRSTSPLVSLVVDTASWPSIPGGEERTAFNAFVVELDPSVPCGAALDFDLLVTSDDGDGAWAPTLRLRRGQLEAVVTQGGGFSQTSLEGPNLWTVDPVDDTPLIPRYHISGLARRSDTVLTSDPIPSVPVDARLEFRHRIDSEATYDGGVLELSVAGGAWFDAEPYFEEGGYFSGLSSEIATDMKSRNAWSGDSSDCYREVSVTLSAFAGQSLQYRFRFATDDSGDDVGWWIDDCIIEYASYVCEQAKTPQQDPDQARPAARATGPVRRP